MATKNQGKSPAAKRASASSRTTLKRDGLTKRGRHCLPANEAGHGRRHRPARAPGLVLPPGTPAGWVVMLTADMKRRKAYRPAP